MDIGRLLKHLIAPHWIVNRAFTRRTLDAIDASLAASEKSHDGELRFAVEAGLHPLPLWRGQTARQRAQEMFGALNVWDTAHNSGVLIYVQLVDRRIEIVADRGISAKVDQRRVLVGRLAIVVWLMLVEKSDCSVLMMGDSAVTCTVST